MFEIICFDMFISSNCSSENIWSIFIHLYLLDVHNHSQPIFTHAYPFLREFHMMPLMEFRAIFEPNAPPYLDPWEYLIVGNT